MEAVVKAGEKSGRESPGGSEAAAPRCHVSFGEALRFWVKLGFISFGGPAGQIAIMHREPVERIGLLLNGLGAGN